MLHSWVTIDIFQTLFQPFMTIACLCTLAVLIENNGLLIWEWLFIDLGVLLRFSINYVDRVKKIWNLNYSLYKSW